MRRATCSRVSPAKGDGKPPSSVSATSAVSRPGRVLVPAKIRSSMASPRSAPARLSPMAQRNASAKLLLPQPLGPTRPVRPGRTSSVARSAKLLKPVRRSWARCAAMALRDAGEAAQEAQGCADGSEHRRAASAGDPALASCIIALRAITALIARNAHKEAFRQGACVLCRVPEIARISNRDVFQVGQVPWFTIEMPRCAIQRNDVGRVPFKPDCSGTSANAPVILHRIRRLLVTRDGAVRWRAASQ